MTELEKTTETELVDNPPQVYVKSPNVIVNFQSNPFITDEKLCEVLGYKRAVNVEKKLKSLGIPVIKGAGKRFFTTLTALDEYLLRECEANVTQKDAAKTTQTV